MTYAHNVGDQSNKILIVSVAFEGANTSQDVSGVTYNGVAMQEVNELQVGTGFIMQVSLWYMLDDQLPDDNTDHNVVVTFTSNSENAIESGAISLYDANQAAPTDFGGTGYNNNTDPVAREYTTTVDNTMAVDVVGCGNASGNYTATGQTERWDDYVGSSGLTAAGGTRLIATAGTVTNSWDYSSSVNRQAMYVCGVQSYTYQSDFEQIRVDVSWDGGSSWSSKQATATTATETTYWYDVTSATTWTPEKLANGQFQVRADAYTVGTASTVSLDWLPVEVTYTLGANQTPSVDSVSISPTPTITLNADTTKTVTITATITDNDGCEDVFTNGSITGVFFDDAAEDDTCSQDDNDCYTSLTLTEVDDTCSGAGDYTADASVDVDVWFIANPSSSWTAKVTATDEASASDSDTQTVTINTLIAFKLDTSTIAYSTVNPNEVSSQQTVLITTTGNAAIDVELSGTSMTWSGNEILVGQQKYSATSGFDWDTQGTALTGTPACHELSTGKPTAHPSNQSENVYWKLKVPTGKAAGGPYSGTNTFDVVSDSSCP